MIRSKYTHLVGYLDPLSKLSLLPWTYFNLKHILEISFARITSHYGLLFSFYYIGRVLGRSFQHHTGLPPLSPILTLLAFTYWILGITSRFSVVCFCYLLLGFGGGLLRSICFPSEEEEESTHYSQTRTKKNENNYYYTAILSLIFVPLFVGFTYSTAITTRNPPFFMCTICGGICLLFAFILFPLETSCLSSCCSSISSFAKRETDPSPVGADASGTGTGDLSSLAGVTEESVTPPENFLAICGNDVAAAKKIYFRTLQWRALERMDEIVDIPQNPETFAMIEKYYPHGFQGRTREGAAVVYEKLGQADASALSHHGITPQHLLRHFMLRNEFLFSRCYANRRDGEILEASATDDKEEKNEIEKADIEDKPVTHLMSVLDVKGVGYYSISADVITFIKVSSEVMDAHFPAVVVRLAIINSPSWFYTVWSGIAGVMPDSVKEKIMFINDMKDLDQYIEPCMRPAEYGGTGTDLCQGADNQAFLHLPTLWADMDMDASSSESSSLLPAGSQAVSSDQSRPETSSMRDWLQGMVRPEGGKKPIAAQKEAFMGESNSYIYDVETGAWVLKLPDEDRELHFLTDAERNANVDRTANNNEMALEEHGLLLAIQAAHDPSTRTSNPPHHLRTTVGSRGSSPRYAHQNRHQTFSEMTVTDSNDEDFSSSSASEIPPSELILLVVSIHFVNCFINGIFVTLVPIWMVSVTEKGGLDYGVRDCAMALSATGVVLLLIRAYFGPKASMALKVFPVRALRIGAGCVTIFSFILTKFARLNGISPWTAMPVHAADSSTLAKANSKTWMMWLMNSLCGHTYTVEADDVANGGEGLFLYYRPSPATNILSVLMPAVLLGGIVSCVYLSRRASSTLLKISLTSVISSPATVEHCVSALASILAPFVSCSIFLWAHRFNKEAPMDDSFFLSLMGAAACFIYLASMFLSLRFRGEFGIMPDDSVAHYQEISSRRSASGDDSSGNDSSGSPLETQTPTCSSLQDSHGNMVMSNMDCLSIPVQDLRYILAFYPGLRKKRRDNPLASRLFNLKLDLKDA